MFTELITGVCRANEVIPRGREITMAILYTRRRTYEMIRIEEKQCTFFLSFFFRKYFPSLNVLKRANFFSLSRKLGAVTHQTGIHVQTGVTITCHLFGVCVCACVRVIKIAHNTCICSMQVRLERVTTKTTPSGKKKGSLSRTSGVQQRSRSKNNYAQCRNSFSSM